MRRIATILVFLSITPKIALSAQDQKNVLIVNPLLLTFGVINVEFERAIDEDKGIALYLGMTGNAPAKICRNYIVGAEQRVSYRYYPKGKGLKGGWIGGNFAYSSADVWKEDNKYVFDISTFALGIEVGYRCVQGSFNIAPLIMLRLPLGDNFLGTKRSSGSVKIPRLGLSFGLNVGWGW